MALILDHCIPSDAPAFAESCISTYEHMPRHITTYAGVPREIMVTMCTKDFQKGIESQTHPTPFKEDHYLKVLDPVSKDLMAFAIWSYWPQGYKLEEDLQAQLHEIPEGANEVAMRRMTYLAEELRTGDEGRKAAHWHLSLLGTHPKYERRGAGAMLIRWAFPQADRDQKRCYVEASSVGHRLYQRCGFEDVRVISVDLDQLGGNNVGVHTWVAMLREPVKA